ncbi:MAG: trimethylamine methyltransferase family protein, partial [Desulfobacterales bacterium]|nr:trimethylamine methyltransferase family protein [Desulfobacterales bacterium]
GDLYEFDTVVRHTSKPVFFCGYSSKGVEYIIEMAREVAGGQARLEARPFIAAYPEPISPLQFPDEIVEKIEVCATNLVPQVISGAQFMGFTAPCTVAGSLALATAESFFGILLAQLFRPGAPCCLTCSPGAGNMRTGISFIASPEMTLALAAQAQIARELGLPTWGLAGATDSKALDAQAGAEGALSAALQALAGVNIIHDVGYMDMGMACSCAMMVLGNEVIHWIKRFMAGVDVTADTLAVEVINAVGPGGHFMTQKHTIDHMRQEVWQPELFFKDSYDAWVKSGETTLEQRADKKVADLLETYQPKALPEDTAARIREIRDRGATEIG